MQRRSMLTTLCANMVINTNIVELITGMKSIRHWVLLSHLGQKIKQWHGQI